MQNIMQYSCFSSAFVTGSHRPALAMRLSTLAALAVASLISACGGGGGDATPVLPTPDSASALSSAAQLQGRWVTASSINPARTGVVLPGSGTNAADADLWLLSADLLSLSKGS